MNKNTQNTNLVLFKSKNQMGTNGGISYIPNVVTGYPVPYDAILVRIKTLLVITTKNIKDMKEFKLHTPEILKKARKSLVGFGGIYLL